MAVMDGLYTIEYFARMLKEKPRWSGPGWTPLCTLLHFWLFSHAPDHSAPCASTATTHSSTVRFLRLPRQVNLYLSQIGVRGPRAQGSPGRRDQAPHRYAFHGTEAAAIKPRSRVTSAMSVQYVGTSHTQPANAA